MEIIYTYDFDTCEELCTKIYNQQPLLLGLDCEWRPNRKNEKNKLAVMQISTSTQCLIIQCIKWETLPKHLKLLITSPNILKTGVGIHGDTKVIRRSFGVNVKGYIDVRYFGVLLYENNLIIPKTCFGLKGLSQYLFGVEIPRGSTRSNWERIPLNDNQILYGAMDCYFSRVTTLILIHCFQQKRMIHPSTDDIMSILNLMDNKKILTRIINKYRYLCDQPFRQPSWLCNSQSSLARKSNNKNSKNEENVKNKSDYTLAKLEEKWLGLHVEKYQKKRKHLEFWNMYGADGRFVARVKKKRVIWYLKRNLGVIVNDKPIDGQLPVFQLTFRLKRYEFPGEDAYVMKSCFVCNQSGNDGKHLFKHSIIPKCYRKYVSDELQRVLSHELIPLCGICKERVENANMIYRKHLEEVKYIKYNPVTFQVKQVSRSASAILRQGDKLPTKRKNELLKIIGEYYQENDIENIDQKMIIKASKVWNNKTFGEILMIRLAETPQELYQFIIGWKEHFVDTLKPKNLKKGWMRDGNKQLREILKLDHDTLQT